MIMMEALSFHLMIFWINDKIEKDEYVMDKYYKKKNLRLSQIGV